MANKTLEIICKGIATASATIRGELDITLQEVNPDFIEQLDIKDIMMWADQKKMMREFDYDELVEYLEDNYSVKVLEQR